jgi:hypothetical protein
MRWGLSLTQEAGIGERDTVAALVQHRLSTGEYIFQPVRFQPVPDENDEAVADGKNQQRRSITLA